MSIVAGPALLALNSLTPLQRTFVHSLPKAELHAHLNGSIPLQALNVLARAYADAFFTPPTPTSLQFYPKGIATNVENGVNDEKPPVHPSTILNSLEKLQSGVSLDAISDFFELFPSIYALTQTEEALAYATRAVLDFFLIPQPTSSFTSRTPPPPSANTLSPSSIPSSSSASSYTSTIGPTEDDSTTYPQCTYLELRTTPRATPSMTRSTYVRTVLDEISRHPCASQVGVIISFDRRMTNEDGEECLGIVRAECERHIQVVFEHEAASLVDARNPPSLGAPNPRWPGIVGVDLCGDPGAGEVDVFGGWVREVRALGRGIGVTMHVAETVNNTPAETLRFLSFKPDRLGHATFLDEEAKKIVLERKTCVEICLTSNLLCKTVADLESHHIRFYLQHNHPIAICTDDVLPFRTTLTGEYALLLAPAPFGLGLSEEEVKRIAEMSLGGRFGQGVTQPQ